jgi:hypothetical protein
MEKQSKWVIDSLVHDFERYLLEVHGEQGIWANTIHV